MKELEFARKIDVDAIRVNDFVQGKKNKMIYKVVAVEVGSVTIQAVDDSATTKTILKTTLVKSYEKYSLLEQLVEPEAVEEQPVEPEVEPVEPVEPEEVAPVTTISTEPKTVQVKVSTEPKSNGKKKLSDEQYLSMIEEYLKDADANKKRIAEKYGVHPSILSDAFSEKYVRKSCKEAISALKIKYGYSK